MDNNPFHARQPQVVGNTFLRTPQREAFQKLVELSSNSDLAMHEVGIILPVGCGKSGCITLTPFAFKSSRTLVVAPGVRIAQQLYSNFDPAHPSYFYEKFSVMKGPPYVEPVEIRGTTTNRADLDEAHVVITNIQQLQGAENRWLAALPSDYFDLIVFDEGHHNVAESWSTLKEKFPAARVVNFSATPLRADGQRMAGNIVYSFPVIRAIEEGYVKRLKGRVLNPQSLRYVRREDDREVEVPLSEVIRLGEEEADFRRSIVTSKRTLNTIVDASIRALEGLRDESGSNQLKVIASALNYEHCRQIVAAYQERGMRADFVHSRQNSPANDRVMQKLENHELDVIVQVRKLGEGFDHPQLAVAAVFSVFANLSPFVQFVGRIMRVIVPNDPHHLLNRGIVVFHSGGNVIPRWRDFQEFSEADQEYFDELLPMENLEFGDSTELEVSPRGERMELSYEVRAQGDIELEELSLIDDDPAALAAIQTLHERGYSGQAVAQALEKLEPVPVTKVRQRQSRRRDLDMRIDNEAGKLLKERGLSAEGQGLDRRRLGRSNFVVVRSALDREVNALVGRSSGQRHEFSIGDFEKIDVEFEALVLRVVNDVFDG